MDSVAPRRAGDDARLDLARRPLSNILGMLKNMLFGTPPAGRGRDALLLLLRLAVGACLFFGHGVGKYPLAVGDAGAFPDPLGLGPRLSVLSSMATECGGSLLLALGLLTRPACGAVVFTMLVVALVVHHHDAWAATEPSVLFALLFAVLGYVGPGRFSLDGWLAKKIGVCA